MVDNGVCGLPNAVTLPRWNNSGDDAVAGDLSVDGAVLLVDAGCGADIVKSPYEIGGKFFGHWADSIVAGCRSVYKSGTQNPA